MVDASKSKPAPASFDAQAALAQLAEAADKKLLSAGAIKNIRVWLSEPRYREYAPLVAQHLAAARWKELDDVFWTIIPFGTGGRRGKMYPIGSNAINDRTIGESAQGLADYVKQVVTSGSPGGVLSCAIAYDTRHQSRHFAELCAEVMVAAGYKVYFLDGYRSTPELSFAVRYQHASCGIMVTASHNPPSDNAVKAYWSTGGQLLPPHDQGAIDRVMSCTTIHRTPFDAGLASGQIVMCQKEVDAAFIAALIQHGWPGPRDLKIVYSPLHGVGASAVLPVLKADGFADVELFGPHAQPDGDFPNVPGHVSNPENPRVFDIVIDRARQAGADLVLATDPDCDRIGLAAPLTTEPGSPWRTMTGNQIGALLAEYLLERRAAAKSLKPEHYLIKTLVTTDLARRIAEAYGVRMFGDLQVGFKYIGGTIDDLGPENFVFGCEESHGFLVGGYARDKDAAVAAMLVAELAARVKADGQTLHQKLDALYWQYGCHAEGQVSVTMPGSEGMKQIQSLMARFRQNPPHTLAGFTVRRVRDYLALKEMEPGGQPRAFEGPVGDMVMIDLGPPGTYVAVRPSGTEPKVKFYTFTFEPAEQLHNLEETKAELAARLDALAKNLSDFAQL
ncbi:MAG TPA: phospho-sugar mutase [Pirellulales bacterium]|jgi:phosphoglucomutase/phosphomannomutase|nr:phospho-sugar mutase [Pirellulales bacterium]